MSGTTRRAFLGTSLAAGTLLAAGIDRSAEQETPPPPAAKTGAAPKPMSILILGGTGFIGPNQVRYAVRRGHKVTLFNRGKTNPGLFPDVEHLEGDRNGKLDALKGRTWDAVIDNPSTLPRWVRDAAQLLKDSAGQYLFISTLSVYADESKPGMDETDRTIVLEDPTTETVTGETYGGLKALAEKEAETAFPGKATIVRPGLIVGPGDNSDRFTYWPVRIDEGGEVLAPGDPTDPVQFIDAADLGEWTIRLVEQRVFGTFNAMGPAAPLSMAEMLYGIRAITSAPVKFTWVPASFLEEQKVAPWMDMPVWVPPAGAPGFSTRSNARAIAKGLTFRPLADTARATLEWHEGRSAEAKAKPRAGLARAREADVLAAWTKKQGA
ncbi:MAG TPA: NAD-dependent epimerase/dehydratase family protein [Thermoanaerobaculia bacterium]